MTEHKLHTAVSHYQPSLPSSQRSGPGQRGPSLCHAPAAQHHPTATRSKLPSQYVHINEAFVSCLAPGTEHKGPCAGRPKQSYKWQEEPHRQAVL